MLEPNTEDYSMVHVLLSGWGGLAAASQQLLRWNDTADIAHNGNFYVSAGWTQFGSSANLNTWTAQSLWPYVPPNRIGNVVYGHLIAAAPGGKFVSAFRISYGTLSQYSESNDHLGEGYVLTSYP